MDKERKENQELVACPLGCKGGVFKNLTYRNDGSVLRCSIICEDCCLESGIYHSIEDAVKHWNTRVSPTLQALDEEKVKSIVHKALDLDALSKNALVKQYLPETWKEILKAEQEIIHEICATFGQSPMASEEEIAKIIWCNQPSSKDQHALNRHIKIKECELIAQAILKFLKER